MLIFKFCGYKSVYSDGSFFAQYRHNPGQKTIPDTTAYYVKHITLSYHVNDTIRDKFCYVRFSTQPHDKTVGKYIPEHSGTANPLTRYTV